MQRYVTPQKKMYVIQCVLPYMHLSVLIPFRGTIYLTTDCQLTRIQKTAEYHTYSVPCTYTMHITTVEYLTLLTHVRCCCVDLQLY